MPDAPEAPEPTSAAPRRPGRALALGFVVAALAAAAAWALRAGPPPPTGAASASASAPASAATPPPPRFALPFAAALREGGTVFVAGRRRGAGGLLLGSYDLESRAVVEFERPLEPSLGRLDELDAFAATGGVVASVEGEGGQRQWLRAATPERLADSPWEPTEPSACATSREIASLARAPEGFQARLAPLGGGVASDAGAPIAGNAASLLCGKTRAFALVEREKERVARSLGVPPLDVALLGGEREQDEAEQSFAAYIAGDELIAVRVGAKSGLRFRSWDGASREPGPWVRADLPPAPDLSIELALVAGDALALVTTHSVEPAKPCPDESSDVVAELSIVRRADGVVRRAADRLETWRCGAEPGPFWGGTPGGRFVVGWPRGVDTACAKLGARYGGLTVAAASVEGKGTPRVERIGAPAEAIEDAGCDDERCVAVALGRGETGACVGTDDERAGAPRVLVYPSPKASDN